MIKVSLLVKENIIQGFEIIGHADFDEYGYDIVCAGVSTLAYTTINTIDQYTKDYDFSDDDLLMRLLVNDLELESKVVLNTFTTGIKTLTQTYGDYVKINYKEI